MDKFVRCLAVLLLVCVTSVTGEEDEFVDLEPVEFTKIEWGTANIVVMVLGAVIMLPIIVIVAALAIFKPHEEHIGKVFKEDGSIDPEATNKRRISLGRKPSLKLLKFLPKKQSSFDLILEDELEDDPEAELKRQKSRDRRRSMLVKSKKLAQHMPEMLNEDIAINKKNIKKGRLSSKSSGLSISSRKNSTNALNI